MWVDGIHEVLIVNSPDGGAFIYTHIYIYLLYLFISHTHTYIYNIYIYNIYHTHIHTYKIHIKPSIPDGGAGAQLLVVLGLGGAEDVGPCVGMYLILFKKKYVCLFEILHFKKNVCMCVFVLFL